MTTPTESNSMKLLAGAIALCVICAAVLGIDYSQVRDRAGQIPTIEHRTSVIEESIKEGAREQASAIRELSLNISKLERTLIRLETRVGE